MFSSYRDSRSKQHKFKLSYFNARGRCEAIRLLFAAGGIDYEDIRLNGHTEWTELKPKTPFGTLPVLEADGHMINQSLAIGRLVAKMCDLAGSNYLHQAQVDSIVDACVDMRELFIASAQSTMSAEQQQGTQEKAVESVLEKVIPIFKNLERELGDDNFFVQNKLSYADIQFYASMEIVVVTLKQPNIMDSYPKLKDLYERIAAVPVIARYLISRPTTPY